MTYLAKAQYLTDAQIVADILAIPKTGFKPNPNTGRIWSPVGVTWHNTGAPSLGQWATYSPAQKDAWGDNLNRYYQGMGWHSGPVAVGTPDGAIQLCDWQADGIHCTCTNSDHYGVETVGNFCTGGDNPTSGAGLASMQSSANIIAALCLRFGWNPREVVGFHRACTADHHACPGNLVSNEFAWGLVEARMTQLKGVTPPPVADSVDASPVAAPIAAPVGSTAWAQAALNKLGNTPLLAVDGDNGPETRAAVKQFQGAHHLDIDGIAGPNTIAALQKALAV